MGSNAGEPLLRPSSPAGFRPREGFRPAHGPPGSNPSDGFIRPHGAVENLLRPAARPGSNPSENPIRAALGMSATEVPFRRAPPPGSSAPGQSRYRVSTESNLNEASLRPLAPVGSNACENLVGSRGTTGTASREPMRGPSRCDGSMRAQLRTQGQAECMDATDDVDQCRTMTAAGPSRGGESTYSDACSPERSVACQLVRASAPVRWPQETQLRWLGPSRG